MSRFPLWLWSNLRVLQEGKEIELNPVPLGYIATAAHCDADGLQDLNKFAMTMREAEIKVAYDEQKLPARADYVSARLMQDRKPVGRAIRQGVPVYVVVACRITKAYERTC
jgi:hypothetical protein